MTNFRAFQPNFSRGELAPALYGRFDVDAWNAAVKKARNVIVLKYGGLTKRPGTRLVGEVLDDSEPNRLIPFQFSLTQTYAVELGQGYLALASSGGRVVEEELAITGITNDAAAQITAAFHGYSVGNFVYFDGIEGDLGDLLNGRRWEVLSIVDDDNFTIDADTAGMGGFAGAAGGITRVGAPDPDPTPPTVPAPVEDDDPPDVVGGGAGYWKFSDVFY